MPSGKPIGLDHRLDLDIVALPVLLPEAHGLTARPVHLLVLVAGVEFEAAVAPHHPVQPHVVGFRTQAHEGVPVQDIRVEAARRVKHAQTAGREIAGILGLIQDVLRPFPIGTDALRVAYDAMQAVGHHVALEPIRRREQLLQPVGPVVQVIVGGGDVCRGEGRQGRDDLLE